MSNAHDQTAEGRREQLIGQAASHFWERGWSFTLRGDHIVVEGCRLHILTLERNLQQALDDLDDLILPPGQRTIQESQTVGMQPDLIWYPASDEAIGTYFDQGGRHIADKSD